uniref:Ribonuclease H-like domain, reverse transcriptase, RNA-dependent DNA polymerase n=1 Tax=Tanacetum cinerariifolium TaxID=118510 RepID=A0A6L2KX14_TANCI|nr:ribonuclease H-like domain, reverse transcriptase, RNA-dependent DNA polymerase [Tanacetum cinerariifolium]
MSDLGLLAYYLGIEITQTNGDITIKQSAYAIKILKEAGMINYIETWIPLDPGTRLTKITKGTTINLIEYQSLIRCLRYLLHTRPNLSYSIGLLSRFMQEPQEQHMKAIRQVLRYVKGTKDYGITYKHNRGNKIHGYSDNSYGVNTQEGKGTTSKIFYYDESPIRWSTQKQAIVALSPCESEFIVVTAAATQALWLKRLLNDGHVITSLVMIHPLRQECYKLPPFPLRFEKHMHKVSCGLGFDTFTNTWKMVYVLLKQFTPPTKPDMVKKNLCTMVDLFGTNSWREIPEVPSYLISRKAVFANACLYWLASYSDIKTEDGGKEDHGVLALKPQEERMGAMLSV